MGSFCLSTKQYINNHTYYVLLFSLFLAIKFPGNTQHPVRQDSTVISAASSSATNGLECPPTLQEQPQAVIPQGLSFIKKMLTYSMFPQFRSGLISYEPGVLRPNGRWQSIPMAKIYRKYQYDFLIWPFIKTQEFCKVSEPPPTI